jgi:hypothetical protein
MPHMGEPPTLHEVVQWHQKLGQDEPQDLQDSQYDIYDDLDLHTKFLKYFEGYMKPKYSQKIGLKKNIVYLAKNDNRFQGKHQPT